MLDTFLNTTLWSFAEQLPEACCEVCLFLEAFFPSIPFSYACTRQRRPFTHHIVTTWRKSMHKASEPRLFQGKERKIKCTLAANLTQFSHTHWSPKLFSRWASCIINSELYSGTNLAWIILSRETCGTWQMSRPMTFKEKKKKENTTTCRSCNLRSV